GRDRVRVKRFPHRASWPAVGSACCRAGTRGSRELVRAGTQRGGWRQSRQVCFARKRETRRLYSGGQRTSRFAWTKTSRANVFLRRHSNPIAAGRGIERGETA